MAWSNAGRCGDRWGVGAATRVWSAAAGACGVGAIVLAAACGGDDGGSGGSGAGVASGAGAGTPAGAGGGGTGGGLGFTSGSGSGSGGGSNGSGGGMNCGKVLPGIVRDFQVSHPDFENYLGSDPGIVAPELGADGKPVYAGDPTTPSTSGQVNFDQWFRDVPGVNIAIPIGIELVPAGGDVYTYQSSAFFPIDGQGFDNEGNSHNYHFTYEIRTEFEYKGGEVFTFTGDDDLFTYINGKLVIDLGGVHGAETGTVDLNDRAAELGITIGQKYPLDFFFAERHTSESNFRIDTTISCFTPIDPPE